MNIKVKKVMSVMLVLAVSASVGNVRVNDAASTPKLNEKKAVINSGDYVYLKVNKVSASKIKSTKWKTSDKSVASISSKTKSICSIKGKKKGMAVITANVTLICNDLCQEVN